MAGNSQYNHQAININHFTVQSLRFKYLADQITQRSTPLSCHNALCAQTPH